MYYSFPTFSRYHWFLQWTAGSKWPPPCVQQLKRGIQIFPWNFMISPFTTKVVLWKGTLSSDGITPGPPGYTWHTLKSGISNFPVFKISNHPLKYRAATLQSFLMVPNATFAHGKYKLYLIHAKQKTANKNIANAIGNIQQRTLFTFFSSQGLAFSLAWSKDKECISVMIQTPWWFLNNTVHHQLYKSQTSHILTCGKRWPWDVDCTCFYLSKSAQEDVVHARGSFQPLDDLGFWDMAIRYSISSST